MINRGDDYRDPNCTPDNWKDIHHCYLTDSKYHGYGVAIDDCFEDQDGYLYAGNGEYGSQVNFCPMCGHKAPKQIGE